MTLTAKGFAGGPMTDADFGAIAAPAAWVESGADYAVSQPSSSTRTASVAAGSAVASGVRVINDAAASQALTAPGSGLQWYMLALRRDWGAKTTSLVILSGPATTDTIAPTAVPSTLPATFKNTPGTAQQDQPLAWVAVLASTAQMTIFDLRLRKAAGIFSATTPHALTVLSLSNSLPPGARMLCASDGVDYRWNGTTWRPWNSEWQSVNVSFNFDGGAGAGGLMQWRYENGYVRVTGRPYLGTAPTLNASLIRFTLPVQVDSTFGFPGAARLLFGDVGNAGYHGVLVFTDTYTAQMFAIDPTALYGRLVPASATVPFTWGQGDYFDIDFSYRPA